MSKKFIAILLYLISGTIIIGLIFSWNFFVWKVLDIVFILVLMSCGLFLQRDDNHSLVERKKLLYLGVILLLIIVAIPFSLQLKNDLDKKAKQCHYEMTNIKENRYQQDEKSYPSQFLGSTFWVSEKHYTYWEIDGMLKNISEKQQYLRGIVLKIYSLEGNNILLADGYLDVQQPITTNQSFPFQVRASIDRKNDISVTKYFHKDDPVRIDVYPYFSTCE